MALATHDSFTEIGGDTTACSFNMLVRDFQPSREGVVSERHVPYGNYTIIQTAGRGAERWSTTLYVPSAAEWDNLRQHVASQGTLAVSGWTSRTAVLVSVQTSQYLPGGQRIVSAEWLLDAD